MAKPDPLDALREKAEAAGVKVDGRWGESRLRKEIAAASSGAKTPAPKEAADESAPKESEPVVDVAPEPAPDSAPEASADDAEVKFQYDRITDSRTNVYVGGTLVGFVTSTPAGYRGYVESSQRNQGIAPPKDVLGRVPSFEAAMKGITDELERFRGSNVLN